MKQKEEIYTAYAESNDMTFIMRDICEGIYVKSTECVGWYFGEPSEESTLAFIGKLKAEY